MGTGSTHRILLTGGTGFIGSHTAVELINSGYEVELLDNLENSSIAVLDKIAQITGVRPKFHLIDLRNHRAVDHCIKNGRFDLVIHFAGLKAVGESVEHPLDYYRTNISTTINLLESMQKYHVNRIIFSSSATVYGNQDGVKLTENHPAGQGITNPYGQTKYMIEQILTDTAAANPSLKVTILRYFNPIGAHPSGLLGENPMNRPNNLMPIIMQAHTGKIPYLSIYGNDYNTPDGTGMRDFIHVVDLARGHVAAVRHMHQGVEIYNLGTGQAASVLEVIETFNRLSHTTLPCKIVPRRPGDAAIVYANPEKANKELHWQANHTVEDAIIDTLNYLNHQEKQSYNSIIPHLRQKVKIRFAKLLNFSVQH